MKFAWEVKVSFLFYLPVSYVVELRLCSFVREVPTEDCSILKGEQLGLHARRCLESQGVLERRMSRKVNAHCCSLINNNANLDV